MLAWRQQPTAIEAELADRGHDIKDWHAGRMSSRKLLVLLRHPRKDGPYERALHDGGWPDFMKMMAEIHKEVALFRASHYVDTDNAYTPKVFIEPAEAKRRAAETAEEEREHEENVNDLYDEVGFT